MAPDVQATDEEKAAVEAMQNNVGVPGDARTYEVTSTDIRLFARAVGYTNPIYFDDDAAKAAGHRALPAPPGHLGRPIFNPASGGGGGGGGGGGANLFKNNLNGGTEVEPIGTVYAGDILTAVSTATSARLMPSRAYGRMVVRTTEAVYTNQDGEVVAKTRGTGISY